MPPADEILDRLDPRIGAWVKAQWGTEVADVRRLAGGVTSTMLRLTGVDGDRAVLRLMTEEPWRRHAEGLLEREAGVQRFLDTTEVPAPRSLAVDSRGAAAGVPAHLMTFMPGTVDLSRSDNAFLDTVSQTLCAIRALDPPSRPRDFQSWAPRSKWIAPDWTRDAELWRHAFSVLEADPPPFSGGFLHRDFHVGNLLWSGGNVTGVVDWVETSWGPERLDVAHVSTYLAMLHAPDVAHRFRERHQANANRVIASDSYWDVMDIVGYLPHPSKVTRPWRQQGVDITDERAMRRLESYLADVLG